jgi:hypothetical protein
MRIGSIKYYHEIVFILEMLRFLLLQLIYIIFFSMMLSWLHSFNLFRFHTYGAGREPERCESQIRAKTLILLSPQYVM